MESKNITEIIPEYVEEIKEISGDISNLELFYSKQRQDLSFLSRFFSPKTINDLTSEKDIEKFSKYFNNYIKVKLQNIKKEYIEPIEQEYSNAKSDFLTLKEPINPEIDRLEQLKKTYNQKIIELNHKLKNNNSLWLGIREKKDSVNRSGRDNLRNQQIKLQTQYYNDYLKNNYQQQWFDYAKQYLSTYAESELLDVLQGKFGKHGDYNNEVTLFTSFCSNVISLEDNIKISQEVKKQIEQIQQQIDDDIDKKEQKYQKELDRIEHEDEIVTTTIVELNNKIANLDKQIEQEKINEKENTFYKMYLQTKSNYETSIKNYEAYLDVINKNYSLLTTVADKTKQVIQYTWDYRKSIKHLSQSSDLSIVLKEISESTFGMNDLINEMVNCSNQLLALTSTTQELEEENI